MEPSIVKLVVILTVATIACVFGACVDTREGRTGQQCDIHQCNGLINPTGKCADKDCFFCVTKEHKAGMSLTGRDHEEVNCANPTPIQPPPPEAPTDGALGQ